MYTQQQYMNNECTHREYYAQFVTQRIRKIVADRIGKDAILASTDEHFNDIPLREWDAVIGFSDYRPSINNTLGLAAHFRECGDCVSASGLTCVMKEAARQIKELTP